MAWIHVCQVHRPRQIIIVALLTSIFWFALNTVILVSYQVNIASNELKVARSLRRGNKSASFRFEQQSDTNKAKKLSPRGISEVRFHEEEFDIINNEIFQHKPSRDTQDIADIVKEKDSLMKGQFNKNTRLETRKKKPKLLKKKLISAVRSVEPNDPKKVRGDTNVGTIPHDPSGPGEDGKPVVVSAKEKPNEKDGYNKYAFNEYASAKISLERSIPDTRSSGCESKSYSVSELPTASVVICFHNEAWSTLLRTVHSVLNRSPPALLYEIILIDDFSTFGLFYLKERNHDISCESFHNKRGYVEMNHLKKPLDDYVSKLTKVRILRTSKREGLIRARLLGANAARAQVITFLDAHCEANVNWLEPLLDRIRQDRTIVSVPVIDIISSSDFSYSRTPAEVIGGFSWDMQFNWHSLPQSIRNQREDSSQPIRTPTMAGGLFSIDRQYFFDSGSYDEGMDVWGGENLEMSFRIWQCGGKLEIIPCSRVGHVFRSRFPYTFPGGYHEVTVNLARAVHVWMDDYKKFVFMKRPDLQGVEHGDLTKRLELRKRLKCKSFKWYMENIYPEQKTPSEDYEAYGEVRNPQTGMCLDTMAKSVGFELGVSPCHGMGGNQHFALTKDDQLKAGQEGSVCVEGAADSVMLVSCEDNRKQWKISQGGLRNTLLGRCLELQDGGNALVMSDCNTSDSQKWIFSKRS